MLGRLGVDVLTVNNRLDESSPTETLAEHSALPSSGSASWSPRPGRRSACGSTRWGSGSSLVDERGVIVDDDRALLVFLDLVAAERHSGQIALPVTTTRVAEQVARFHGVDIHWTPTSPDELTRAAEAPDVIFAGDGRGGFVVPEFAPAIDGIAAFVRLPGWSPARS